ncbi:MAG: cation-translocating P-type ATPase [Mycobacteriaceae bacterium]|nr:cation-translocating P-type ATPase [Mycobacteriaceae bacterium]
MLPDVPKVAATVVGEFTRGAPGRRCWRGADNNWIEIRGLNHPQSGLQLGQTVLEAVRAQPGVLWAELNYPLARIVVRVHPDGPSLAQLCQTVDAAENQSRRAGPAHGRDCPTDLPADGLVQANAFAAVTLNAIGLCTAVAGRVLMWRPLPAGLTALVTVVDYQPRLRHVVEDRLGTSAADTALALAASTVYTLAQAPASLAVDLLTSLAKAGELRTAARVWEQRQPELAEHAACPPAHPRPRPRPRPHGPVERHADRSAMVQVLSSGAIGLATANVTAAATAAVVAAPKAARITRECFAATLARGLADGHGILELHPEALRRLDRVDTVLVDPRALDTAELKASRIEADSERDRAAAWSWAQHELERNRLTPGWHPVPSGNGRKSAARVLVRPVHHPLSSAIAAEVRRAEAEVVSLDIETLDDLRSMFDDLYPAGQDLDVALADAVERLQTAGRTVALVSSRAAQALAAADVAIGLIPQDGPPPWQAHLMVDDLPAAWQILHALPAARRASRRGVDLATAATVLGALLMVPGVRGRGPGPVTAGAAVGILTGYRLARGAMRDTAPRVAPTYEWHAMPVEQVRRLLPPPAADEPRPRPAHEEAPGHGPVAVATRVAGRVRGSVGEFASAVRGELSDPITPLLATGSAASALLGSPLDAGLVGSVVAANAMLSAAQQVRAERLLRRMLSVQEPKARVLREHGTDGSSAQTVDAACLRPGDVVEVRPGEVVAADARLIDASDLEVDESALTGESLPVLKQTAPTPGVALAERTSMLYAATTVVAGTAVAIVTAVGEQTQARRAAQAPAREGSAVGLQGQLRELTTRAFPVSLAGGALVTGLGLLRMRGLRQALSSGVAVSVAAVPEGLPLVATLAQQASARRLTRMGVLVRSPRSVEALGRVDVVCFDKTGTLSENRLKVTTVHPAQGFSRDDVLRSAALATPPANGGRHEHATDRAVVAAADLSDPADPATAYLPFRSGRPFSASVSGTELVIKGAPEAVLAAGVSSTEPVAKVVGEMAADGLRVIAVARRDLTSQQARAAGDDSDEFVDLCHQGLQIMGLLGLSDTARPEAAGVLATLSEKQVGIRLITGDHPVTAAAIANELGLPVTRDQVISGTDWEALSRRAQEQAVTDRLVFARMSPEHKVQIVQTLERMGRVCAMVGDGANDAAAIRAATVGIGVVARGSDPARTAADVMLLDARIEALLDAVEEGRQLWRRVQAAVSVLLGGNAGEVAFAIAGTAITGRSPLNTRQLLLVNMLTDALPAAALAVSPVNGAGRGAGRGPDQAALWRTVAVRGGTTAAGAFAAWVLASLTGRPQRASTVALVALVATQLGQTLIDSHSPLVVGTAIGSLVALGAVISTPGVSQILGSTPLGPVGWGQALAMAAAATAAAAVAPRVAGALTRRGVPQPGQLLHTARLGTPRPRPYQQAATVPPTPSTARAHVKLTQLTDNRSPQAT